MASEAPVLQANAGRVMELALEDRYKEVSITGSGLEERLVDEVRPGLELRTDEIEHLVTFPGYGWHHALAEHPLINYHEGYTCRARIDATFARAGLTPDIVMSALDADLIKTYVGVGPGVGIVASMAFEAQRARGLVLLPAQHIFEPNTTLIAVRRGHFLRGFAYRFLQEGVPALSKSHVR